MPVSWRSTRVRYAAVLAAVLLGCAAGPLQAQDAVALGRPVPNWCRPSPCVTGEGTPVTPPQGEPIIPPEFVTPGSRGPAESQIAYLPPMLSDFFAPSGSLRTVFFGANGSPPTAHTFRVPSAGHGFKVADYESPIPRSRVFVNYNYYNNVNKDFDSATQSGVGRIDVHREIFGFEKTFFDGNASIGMRLPLNTLNTAGGTTPGLGGTFTDLGDLTIVFKGILLRNCETGNLLSGGLTLTPTTGPSTFAGVPTIGSSGVVTPPTPPPPPPPPPPPQSNFAFAPILRTTFSQQTQTTANLSALTATTHDFLVQPFLGGALFFGDMYVHGFTAIDIATDPNDVTLWYNDVGVGYFLIRRRGDDRLLTAVIPTVEMHVNTPLNHRGTFNGPTGTPDWVDFTGGVTLEFSHRSTLAVGACAPVTGAKPYDVEGLLQFNFRF